MQNILIYSYDNQLLPEKKSPEAMCRDIKAAEAFTLQPWEVKLIKSWIKTFIPTGRCCKMYARSSLPLKNGLMLANNTGIIDSDYRGEYLMQIYNFTTKAIHIEKYTRLCQLEFCPHHRNTNTFWTEKTPSLEMKVDAEIFEHFDEHFPSERGAGGFGSTGKL